MPLARRLSPVEGIEVGTYYVEWTVKMRLLALSALAAPASLLAQEAVPRFAFEIRAGYSHSTQSLGRTGILGGGSTGLGYVAFEKMSAAPVLGGGVTGYIAGPFSLRLTADRTLGAKADGQWFCEGFSPCPSVLQLVEGDVGLWSVGADLQVHLATSGWTVHPVASLGVSRRSYQLRWDAPVDEVPIPTAYDRTSYHLRPGLGILARVGPAILLLEASATVGSFGAERPLFIEGTVPVDNEGDPETQVDLGVTVGLRLPIG